MILPLPTKATLSLALHLVRSRFVVKLAWGMGALTTLVGMGLAGMLAKEGANPPLASLLLLMENAFAYGIGFLVAFGGATQAFRQDRDEGIRALLAARGVTTSEYLVARVAGLALAVAIPTVGGTALTGLVALLVAHRASVLPETARAVLVGVGYASAFSLMVALVALVALGARNRAGGYIVLVVLFLLPDFLSPWTSPLVPPAWAGLVSLPGVLTTLRDTLLPGSFDGALLVRGLAALAGVLLVLALLVRAELFRLDSDGGGRSR